MKSWTSSSGWGGDGAFKGGELKFSEKKFFIFTLDSCRASQVTQGEVIREWQALKRAGWDQIREMYVWLCIKMCKHLDYFSVCAPEAWKGRESLWLPWKLAGILPFCPFLSLGLVNTKGGEGKSEIVQLVCFLLGFKHSWDYCQVLLLPPALPPHWGGPAEPQVCPLTCVCHCITC